MRFRRTRLTDREWYRGDLTWMLRPHGQAQVHDFILSCSTEADTVEPIVVNAHRRLGKSFLNVLMGVQACIRRAGQFVIYACGDEKQVLSIVEPLLMQVLQTVPPDLKPRTRGNRYAFKNPAHDDPTPSYFRLVGANYRNGDMGRGTACDFALLDEVRDFKKLRYFVESVLLYQFVGREDPRLVMTSTVPWSLDHDFTRPDTGYIAEAQRKNRYICIPASKNPDYTERDKRLVLKVIPGGPQDHSYRREAECELIGDEDRLITPEYQNHRDVILVEKWEEPRWFQPCVVLDSGFDPDSTAILWSYHDFLAGVLVFVHEHVQRRMTTAEIAKAVKDGTHKLGWDKNYYRVRQLADIEPRGLEDLRRDFQLSFAPVLKYKAQASLASFRHRIGAEDIRILKKGCPQLDYQLLHGIWNERMSDYERSDTLGHWDAGKAAVYTNRCINWRHNPYPDNWNKVVFAGSKGYDNPQLSKWSDVFKKALGRKPL